MEAVGSFEKLREALGSFGKLATSKKFMPNASKSKQPKQGGSIAMELNISGLRVYNS